MLKKTTALALVAYMHSQRPNAATTAPPFARACALC